ncbi:hypothetical protein BH09MYX1_BH09MYX1_38980 [soil metagenome]
MRSLLLLFLAACASERPPTLSDSDAAAPQYDAEAPALAPKDAGFADDAGVTYAREYEGVCNQGSLPVWHFFDFKTETAKDSSIILRAQTATTYAGLDAAPIVDLATVQGAAVVDWAGVDIQSALVAAGQKSKLFLRIRLTLVRATDGTSPVVNATRQRYDCILSQ